MKGINLTQISSDRIYLILAALLYLAALYFSYDKYMSIYWEYFGFTYEAWDLADLIFATSLTLLGCILAPVSLNWASSLIVTLLFIVVYMPTVVVTLSLDVDGIYKYGELLVALGVGFGVINYSSRANVKFNWTRIYIPWVLFLSIMLIIWLCCVLVLVYYYSSSIRFVGFDDIYTQRFLARNTDVPVAIAYVKSLFINIVCAFFMSLGIVCNKWRFFFLGASGCILMYMIVAAKFAFALPFAFLILGYMLKLKSHYQRKTWFLVVMFGFFVIVSTVMVDLGYLWRLIASLLICRTLAIPGLMLSVYYDLFSIEGFTWWSHVKGFSLLVTAPDNFINDPIWPYLGLIIGDRVYGNVNLNGNANFWAGDGVAAAGAVGILVISVLVAIWLRFLNESSRHWNSKFVILSILPFAVSLTNMNFFTSILSFGGIIWMAFFSIIGVGVDWPKELNKN